MDSRPQLWTLDSRPQQWTAAIVMVSRPQRWSSGHSHGQLLTTYVKHVHCTVHNYSIAMFYDLQTRGAAAELCRPPWPTGTAPRASLPETEPCTKQRVSRLGMEPCTPATGISFHHCRVAQFAKLIIYHKTKFFLGGGYGYMFHLIYSTVKQ